MAGYSKGIVDTRKLNKNSKAKLGRGGDTKIREVDNRASHVNALEAYLIDVNGKAGEDYAKRVGAGTVNPLTGMPEYHSEGWDSDSESFAIGETHTHNAEGNVVWGGDRYLSPSDPGHTVKAEVVDPNAPDPYSYEGLKDVTGAQLTAFDKTLGADDVQYFQDIFSDKPFGFLGKQQELTTGRAGQTRGFTERGLQSAYGTTMGELGSREQSLGLEREGLGLKTRGFDIQEESLTAQQAALGRTTGRGYAQATGATATAASRSGLATSGTITQGLETQKKQLFQDYAAGTQDIGRQRAGVQIGREGIDIAGRGIDIAMGDIGRQRGTALDTLTLGKDVAGADYDYSVAGAGLDFAKGTYTEQQRQLDEYWEMIGLRQAAG